MDSRRIFAAAVFLVGAACGTLGGGSGGGENLPNRGVVPYDRAIGADQSPIFAARAPEGSVLREPSAVVRGDAQIDLYFEITSTSSSSIAVARSDASGIVFGTPELLDLGDTGKNARAPSVIRVDGIAHLVFASADGRAIFHATSTDGRTFEVGVEPIFAAEAPFEEGGIGAPSLISLGEGAFELYYETRAAPGAGGAAAKPAIARATGVLEGGRLVFTRRGVVLSAGEGCKDPSGDDVACWDAGGVASPEARLASTATMRDLRRLMYTGIGAGNTPEVGIGFAGSFDGASFERSPFNPIVDAEDVREEGPTNVRFGDRYLLFFVEGAAGIAVSIDAKGEPSETF